MDKKQIKSGLGIIGGVFLLCLIWTFVINFFGDTVSYIFIYYINPFFVYLPLAVLTIAVILFVISLFFNKSKFVKIISGSLVVLTFIYLGIMGGLFVTSRNKAEMLEESETTQKLFEASSLIKPEQKFTACTDDPIYDETFWIASGNMFLYNGEHQFELINDNDKRADVTVEAYYFKNYPKILHKKLIKDLKDTYFYNDYRTYHIEVRKRDVIEVQHDGIRYYYCNKDERYQNYSNFTNKVYFAAVIEYESDIVVISMHIDYKMILEMKPTAIIDNVINSLWQK